MKSFEGIMIIRITKKIIWTNPDGQVAQCEDYQLPFHDVVPPDPSFEDMHQVKRFIGRWNIMWICKIKEIYCIKFAFSLSHAAVFRWSVFDKWGQNALPDGKVGSEHSKPPIQIFPFFSLGHFVLQVQKRCERWRVLLLSVGIIVLQFGSQHSESRRLLQGEHRLRTLYILYYELLFHLFLWKDILLHASKIWNCF